MQAFAALLDTLIASSPARKPAVEQMILDTFQCRKAVLALDMSGFTLAARRDGILAYLCQIRRMHKITRPIVEAHHGEVVKNEADNLLAVFNDPSDAVAAALAMVKGAVTEGEAPVLAFSVGIDVGDILLIHQVDCFGDAVNLAYKLGEDIARPGEVLVTEAVQQVLAGHVDWNFTAMQIAISGMQVPAFSVQFPPMNSGQTE